MNLIQLLGVKSKQPLGGRYKLLQPLGQGGFGHTFLATDLHLPNHPTCVIKQLKPHVQDRKNLVTARRLFETEARVLYQLGAHDQIPRLLAHFEDRQEFYLAQEFIEGESLANLIQPGQPWSEAQVRQLLLDILKPLAFVHGQGVIHRDLKPANLIRRHIDGHMVLIDFGAVKQVSERRIQSNHQQVSQTIAIGTQGYMPNEQLAGTPWFSSDLYAVGMMCLQALTGMAPHRLKRDPYTSEIVWQSPDLAISNSFKAILNRMVRYDFRERYPTAKEALADLQTLPDVDIQTAQIKPGNISTELPTEIVALGQPSIATAIATAPTTISPESIETTVEKRAQPPSSITVFPPTTTATLAVERLGRLPLTETLPTQTNATVAATPTLVSHQRRVPWSTLGLSLLTIATLGFLPSRQVSSNLAAQSLETTPTQVETAISTTSESGPRSLDPTPPDPAVTAQPEAAIPEETAASQPEPSPQPPAAEVLLIKANDLRQHQQYEAALQTYDQVIANQPEQVESHWGQCYSLNQLQAYDQAIEACDRALGLNPEHIQSLWSKGYALEQQGNPQAALELYDKVLELDPDHTEAWNNKGGILLQQQRFEEALDAFDTAKGLAPNLAAVWNNRGAALWSLQQWDGAIASIEKALELQPDYPEAQALREQIRQTLGR